MSRKPTQRLPSASDMLLQGPPMLVKASVTVEQGHAICFLC